MTDASKDPWRCGPCRRLVKAAISFCPNCGGHWTDIADEDYVHGQARKSQSSKGWEWNQWTDWNGAQSRTTSPTYEKPVSTSPQRAEKERERARASLQRQTLLVAHPRFHHCHPHSQRVAPYAVTTTAPPWTSEKSMDQPSLNQELIQAVRKAFPDSAVLPQELKEILDKTENTEMKKITSDLHKSTSCPWEGTQAASRAAGSQVAAQGEVGAALECFVGRLAEADRKLRQAAGAVQYVDPTSDHRTALRSELDSAAQRKSCPGSKFRIPPGGSPSRKSRCRVGGRGGKEAQGEDARDHRKSSQGCCVACNRSCGSGCLSSGEASKVQRATTTWRKWHGCNYEDWLYLKDGQHCFLSPESAMWATSFSQDGCFQ